jgi:RNA polymerase sigma-70 factor (ECF subfamily)
VQDHGDLEAALSRLPDDERETLLLTAVDGLGYREVAEILGCSLGTVATRRCAAIQKLRRRLAP